MTKSHEPYIDGRKKVYTVKIGSIRNPFDFEHMLQQYLSSTGMSYEGLIEVTYEEEKP